MLLNIPTSKDIFIEVDGEKVAVVESYKAKSTRESSSIKEFGNSDAVFTISGNSVHTIELKRVYFVSSDKEMLDFYNLDNFTVVIVKPNKRILYTGCQWTSITEGVAIDEPCIETIFVTSARRLEL